MRAKEFILEQKALRQTVKDAIPNANVLPGFKNQDMYKQYRMGIALASARAIKNGEVEFNSESAFGENMLVVARTAEEEQQLDMALSLMPNSGGRVKISTTKSEESLDTNSRSPVAPKPLIKRRS
ncbi:MAG: hypothetical protein N2235_02455 [Fischerella sp.]|nr:hypothetical protein [Fischerella sp.]